MLSIQYIISVKKLLRYCTFFFHTKLSIFSVCLTQHSHLGLAMAQGLSCHLWPVTAIWDSTALVTV